MIWIVPYGTIIKRISIIFKINFNFYILEGFHMNGSCDMTSVSGAPKKKIS